MMKLLSCILWLAAGLYSDLKRYAGVYLPAGGIYFAQTSRVQTGKMGKMMSGKGMMGHQRMSDQSMMSRDHMGKGRF
jgi:hypothetical protein